MNRAQANNKFGSDPIDAISPYVEEVESGQLINELNIFFNETKYSSTEAHIIVHPFFYENKLHELANEHSATRRDYAIYEEEYAGIKARILNLIKDSTIPIIIFEEEKNLQPLLYRLLEFMPLQDIKRKVIIVPTKADSPTPEIGNISQKEQAWNILRMRLEQLGFSKFTISGTSLTINPKSVVVQNGCVGQTYNELFNRGFMASITDLTHPGASESLFYQT